MKNEEKLNIKKDLDKIGFFDIIQKYGLFNFIRRKDMWIGKIEDLKDCTLISDKITARILDFIKNNDMSSLSNGRHDICDGAYVNLSPFFPSHPKLSAVWIRSYFYKGFTKVYKQAPHWII